MLELISNTVMTDYANYPCKTREEAEALYMTLKTCGMQGAVGHQERTGSKTADLEDRSKGLTDKTFGPLNWPVLTPPA